MTSQQIRDDFFQFFKEHGHTVVPSGPVVPFNDPTLLFTNAGMNQFKDVFLGTGTRSYRRAVDTQKCIRVSGKHNDLEEVGRDTYHHTFFEMLGNWSFGDYYKKEAIRWAWELLTGVWKLPKERLWATVYKDDDEAALLWKEETDIDPAHILRFGEKDNFWEMGETGPCGPCSEIHMDRTPEGTATASMVNSGTPDVIEIWNLVFIQYDRDAAGTLIPLPAKHVDTGMGFERMCAILQNKTSNYDTDVFIPLITEAARISGVHYHGAMDGSISRQQQDIDTALRVIADHVRTLTFAIADGATPSNEGRGYVLRRILRRAARFGRTLGMHEPFIHRLVPTIVATMGNIFPEIGTQQSHIEQIIKGEEEGFSATLDRGLEIFEEVVRSTEQKKRKEIDPNDVFRLYDTFGFPFDLTQLMATERGLTVDEKAFLGLLEEQRTRSRESGKHGAASDGIVFSLGANAPPPTEFTGYDHLEEPQSRVLALEGEYLILDKTPFYAESGGQVGDTGILAGDRVELQVLDTQKSGGVYAHRVGHIATNLTGKGLQARVDKERRFAIMQNHTATHLVHAALRKILGTHVHQAGSLVAPDHLRFDFAHFSRVEEAQLAEIEALVNEKIVSDIPLTHHRNIPFDEATKMGALMFFGDKYGDRVNVVEFGEFSKEFCGGTHVRSTKEIGYFKFRYEGSVASGTRRIEAVTAAQALELLNIRERDFGERLEYAFAQVGEIEELVRGGEVSRPVDPEPLIRELEQLKKSGITTASDYAAYSAAFAAQGDRQRRLEEIILRLADEKKQLERELSRSRVRSLSSDIDSLIRSGVRLDGLTLVSARVDVASIDELKALGDRLRSRIGSGVGILASVLDEKVALVCVVSDDLVASKKLAAGPIVGAVAKLLGGGGGGRPHMATAGGKDIGKLSEALKNTESIVRTFLHL